MPLQDLTSPPTAPSRSDDPDTFIARADAFVAWFPTHVSEMQTLTAQLEAMAALVAVAPAYADTLLKVIADSGLTPASNKAVYFSGASTAALMDMTSVARTLLAQSTQADMRTTGLGMTANGSSLVAAANYAAMRTLLSVLSEAEADAAYQPLFGTIDAGTWTPTLTNETNITTSTAEPGEYMRLGNRIHCMCHLQITPTATGLVEMGVSLPVASDFDHSRRGGGSLSSALGTCSGLVAGDATNDRLKVRANATVTSAVDVVLHATYRVM